MGRYPRFKSGRRQARAGKCARVCKVWCGALTDRAVSSPQGDLIVDVAFGEKVAKLKGVDDLSKPLILIDT